MLEPAVSEHIHTAQDSSKTLTIDGTLFDITIECSPEDVSSPALERLQMKVLTGREVAPDQHLLDRTSPTTWRYQGIIELFRDLGQLLIIIQSEDAGEFGFHDLTEEISRYLGSKATTQTHVPGHRIVTDEGKPSLWIRFVVAAVPGEPDWQHLSAQSHERPKTTNHSEEILAAIDCYNAGRASLERSKKTGSVLDISNAIDNLHLAVSLLPQGHEKKCAYLNDLGNLYNIRFRRTGNLVDNSAAIEYHQKSVELTPEGHPNMHSFLNNLGSSFLVRFQETKTLADLSAAIENHQKSVELTPEGHPGMHSVLNNLGSSFLQRFDSTGDLADISAAIEHQQKSVELTPGQHPNMPIRFNNLGNSLSKRFKQTGQLADITAAIEHHQKSVDLTPKGHTDLPARLTNLGNSFKERFEQTKDPTDIAAAIHCCQTSVDLTPEGHDDLHRRVGCLAIVLRTRFQHSNRVEDCQAAARNFRLAATQATGRPTSRLRAAASWAVCCSDLGDYASCLQAYGVAIELLPLVASLNQTIHSRHTSLSEISTLTVDAVSAALLLESNNIALEWFEQGRCLTWNQLNQLRTPVDHLQQENANLAGSFLTLSKALEISGSRAEIPWRAGTTITQQIAVEGQVRSQLKLAQEFEQLLATIRALPNFNDFLRSPKAGNILSQLPSNGPVVLINIDKIMHRCDALALMHGVDQPIHIELNDFTYEKAELLRKQLGYHLTSGKLRVRDSGDRAGRLARRLDTGLYHILRELWDGVVWPILQALGYSSPPVHRNRIWWCLTGPLAFLPIHAAGVYNTGSKLSGRCLSDFAVSSYIPTVTTLVEKLKNDANLQRQNTRVLLLSQPNALPDFPIPGTIEETKTVLKTMQNDEVEALLLEDEEGTKDRVTREMETHGWIHIASHASQDPTEPLKSGFYLHDKQQLELLEIIRQKLPSAEFAFLSACETSVGDENLSEEAVHLAAGMLAAGYQGVAATMWSINDRYAPKIAEDFYGYLLQEKKDSGAHRLDSRRAAYALDDATRKIREKLGDSEDALLTWVPYIHLGL